MIGFLPVSILAYIFNGGSILIDKVLLRRTMHAPIIYTFYVNVLQIAVLLLIPFSSNLVVDKFFILAVLSGWVSVFAVYTFFVSLKENEASVVAPLVGVFNPLFTIILGTLFLQLYLSRMQNIAVVVLIIGTIIITFNLWFSKVKFDRKFLWILISGFLYAVSYVLLREAFSGTSFINGLVVSRVASGFLVLTLLVSPKMRAGLFHLEKERNGITSKTTLILMGAGQSMGAMSGLLITFGVSLANPALVNSLFGIQYVTILIVAIFLSKKHPQLLDEEITRKSIIQKIIGVGVLTLGLYFLTL